MLTYDLRPARRADAPSVLRLAREAGSGAAPALPEEDAPEQGARAWVLTADERLVGHCASVPSTVWIGGEERVFARVAPPVLDREHRARIEAEGAHERLAARVVESTFRPGGDLALQALVHEDDWRSMERLFRLEIVRTVSALELDLAGGDLWRPDEGLTELGSFGVETRWLWDRCAGGFGASAIRDPRFLEERFAGDEGTRHIGWRDREGVLRGYASWCNVSGPSGPNGTVGTIVDWLVPPTEVEVGARLFRACSERARSEGARALAAMLPGWSPWFDMFQAWGALVQPSAWLVAARTEVSRYDVFWLRENWWYQPADLTGRGGYPRF